MKKSIFTLLAIVAAVFTMSSCSKDNGSSNDINVPDQDNTKYNTYQYQLAATNDALEFFDITITRTVAGKSTTFELNKSSKITPTDIYGNVKAVYDSKSMDLDNFKAEKGAEIKVTVKVTPKSNWQSVLDSKGDGNINIFYEVTKISTEDGETNKFNNIYNSHLSAKSDFTQAKLDEVAADMSSLLSFSNK